MEQHDFKKPYVPDYWRGSISNDWVVEPSKEREVYVDFLDFLRGQEI